MGGRFKTHFIHDVLDTYPGIVRYELCSGLQAVIPDIHIWDLPDQQLELAVKVGSAQIHVFCQILDAERRIIQVLTDRIIHPFNKLPIDP